MPKNRYGDNAVQAGPIAIVGMGMRLPGGVNSSGSFWDFIVNKRDGRCRVPKDRYNVDAFYSPVRKSGTVKSEYGYFLQDSNLQHLDTSHFSMNQGEVEKLDPQQRLLLEVVWECFESAGETEWKGKDIGCYVGVYGGDWLDMNNRDVQNFGAYRLTGVGDFVLGNRISYEYDLKGPSMTIKTGCSSALIGLHTACQAILSGECSAALVCGTNLILDPGMSIAMTEQGVLSPTGSSKSFDAQADGYARAEAINALYIKPLSAALSNKDPIRAVIRSTATNADGKTSGIALPNPDSHVAMMRHAHDIAGLECSKTSFVECHGPGTPAGDSMEGQAVARVFSEKGVFIGSVKPNMGHSEGAAGITSVIKMVLALENRTIPPNINFITPNPNIPFEEAHLEVPTEAIPWPTDRLQRASINSFGFGGANAHAIIDSATEYEVKVFAKKNNSSYRLLLFSANHPESLHRLVDEHRMYLQKKPTAIGDLAYTLACRRKHLLYRSFSVNNGLEVFNISTPRKAVSPPTIIFVFTGQGAQWSGMARELIKEYNSFANDIREMDEDLARLPDPPAWTIEGELLRPHDLGRLGKAEISQPVCTAVQVALVNLLRTWNVSPAAVVGHSSGEIAAAYACSALTATEAVRIAYCRGQSLKLSTPAGSMAAVGLSEAETSTYLVRGVTIACENSPSSTTISGDDTQIRLIIAKLREERPTVFVRHLNVDKAYHSDHMSEIGSTFEAQIEGYVRCEQPQIGFYSSVNGRRMNESDGLNAPYWRQNLESRVLFHNAVKSILNEEQRNRLFVEIGPHSALEGPLKQIFKTSNSQDLYVPTLVRHEHSIKSLLTMAGRLYSNNVLLNFPTISPPGFVLTDLPTRPWHHKATYWSESRLSKEWRFRKFPRHEILGSRVLEGNDMEPTWRNILHLDEIPWISDHKIYDDVVFPAAGFIAMAIEAIRQIIGMEESISSRHVEIHRALVLDRSISVETMTSLRPVRLTNSSDSSWYEFSILSHNGEKWEKHCTGEIKGAIEQIYPVASVALDSRRISSPYWYQTLKKAGLNYGGAFEGLAEISAGVVEKSASASIKPYQGPYLIHPATIDMCLQIFSIAVSNGIPRRFDRVFMPVSIEALEVRTSNSNLTVQAAAVSSSRKVIKGHVVARTDEQQPAISMTGVKLSSLETSKALAISEAHSIAQLEWRPYIDLLDPANLIFASGGSRESRILCEKLTILCIIETSLRLEALQTPLKYLEKYRSWLNVQLALAQEGRYDLIQDAQELTRLSSAERNILVSDLCREAKSTDAAALATAIEVILKFAADVFQGKVQALEPLMQGDVLLKLYDWLVGDWRGFLRVLSHGKPNMRILEIGAGTGGTTASVLGCLISNAGCSNYSKYTYTDVSPGFFNAAKERFSHAPNMEYVVLDISKDPIVQGFVAESYDLILAANVLHATPKIKDTILNVQKLLHPRGRVLLQELSPTMRCINYIMGILPGWWLGEEDGRYSQPYLPLERWDVELRSAGFQGVDASIYDDHIPYQINMTMIATMSSKTKLTKKVALLCEEEHTSALDHVHRYFFERGYAVLWTHLDQEPPNDRDVVSLLDWNGPFLSGISADKWHSFREYMGNLKRGLMWVTNSIHIECKNPAYGMILGVTRTMRSELSIDVATVETDTSSAAAWTTLIQVFEHFQCRDKDSNVDPDYEFALSEGTVYAGRYEWSSVNQELSASSVLQKSNSRALEVGTYGLLQTLRWEQSISDHLHLADNEVLIEIRSVGINFRDILIAMGQVEETDGALGSDGSGIIRGIGSKVSDLMVGDRVFVLTTGCFSTFLRSSSSNCAKIPARLSFEDAATMPSVYSTVIHSLIDIGHLRKDQTVLIHSACGGVGIAAIHICRMIGAQVFATVGTEEKKEYLNDVYGIPRDRIFNSRDASFHSGIMKRTANRGVDLVLNSLSGELLHLSWQCVAEFGSFIEIGKRDIRGRGKLSMTAFGSNRAFFGVDLGQMCTQKPDMIKQLLQKCTELYDQDLIRPIHPITCFDASEVENAFRSMQKGDHIGKIIVALPENVNDLPTEGTSSLSLRSDFAYLLIGGLGGLGRAVSTWMIERGAKHLIYLSRSAGKSKDDKDFMHDLQIEGCNTQAFAGDVADPTVVRKVVKLAVRPIIGVIQMSMILKDRGFLQMTYNDWQSAIAPKVNGTWNLHNELATQDLDFFVLFGSLSGLIGQIGQANYAASNTFLDAFVQYRHGLGLPCSVLDIGLMGDVGYISEKPSMLAQLRSVGMQSLQECNLLDALHLAILRSPPPTSAIHNPKTKTTAIDAKWARGLSNPGHLALGLSLHVRHADPKNRTLWKRDARMSRYPGTEQTISLPSTSTSTSLDDLLLPFLSTLANDPSALEDETKSADFLAAQIGKQLYSFLLLAESQEELDLERALSDLGVDSLVSIEIRNWWRQMLGLEINVLEIMTAGSIKALGKMAARGLREKYLRRDE